MKKKILSVLFSNIAGAGLGFLLNISLARILNVESYGEISLIFSIVIVLYTLLDFGFNTTQVIFYNNNKNNYDSAVLLGVIKSFYFKWFICITFVSLIAISLLSIKYEFSFMESLCIFSSFMFYSLYRFDVSTFQALGNWNKYNVLNVLNNVIKFSAIMLCVGISFVFVDAESFYPAILLGYFVYSILLYSCSYQYQNEKKVSNNKLDVDHKELSKSFYKTLRPLGASSAIVVVIMRIDVFIIEYFMTLRDLAIYFAANSLAMIFPVVTGSLMSFFIQKAAQSDKTYLITLVKQQLKVAKFLPVVFLFFSLLSPLVFGILYPEDYQSGATIFTILLFSHIGGMAFSPIESYFYANRSPVILKLKVFQLITAVSMQLLLINPLGLNGVALAILISRVIGWSYVALLSYKELKNV